MTRYFAIHGTMRTGSNLLERSLAALGDTACYGEAFNPGFVGGPRKNDLLGWKVADRDADPLGFLAALRREAGGRIPGFRIFDGHDDTVAAHALADPDCARIVLRRDPLHTWVSLQIARETGQWMLRRARRRQSAVIRFDPRAFVAWRDHAARHYQRIADRMAAAGTTALWLDYETLTLRESIAAAAHHVGSAGEPPETAPILRQNPARLSQKVANYDELCAWLGHDPDPPADPPVEAPVPEPGSVLLSHHLPLAALAVPGPGLAPALALMQRLETRVTGGRAVPAWRLVKNPARHFSVGPEDAGLAGRHVFALISHPARRLHWLFLDSLLGSGGGDLVVREALATRLGALPPAEDLARGEAPFSPERHRATFGAWLDLLAEAQEGRGPLATSPARLTQAAALEALCASRQADTLARLEDFPPLAAMLASAAGVDPLPPGQVSALARSGAFGAWSPSSVLDAGLAARIRALHGRDLAAFGYDEMPETQG